jgi:signal transduction histidine kinase
MTSLQNTNGIGSALSRSRLIVGLMVLILALILGLAWQANRVVQAHKETATNVLRDYARLAAEEFSRRAMAATGYYGYYTFMNGLSELAGQGRDIVAAYSEQGEAPNNSAALYVFNIDLADGRLTVSRDNKFTAKTRAYLANELVALAREPLPETSFIMRHVDIDGQQRSFVATRTATDDRVFGIEVDPEWQTQTLQRAFDENTLLPPSLADGSVTNDRIYLRMQDSVGDIVFEAGMPTDDAAIASLYLTDEYGGVFYGHSIVAAIDPALAETLIIGGLPRSRLPVLVTIIVLAIGLLIVAVRQLQRENDVIRMRSNFVAEVSHELRTPLAQIRMFTETLLLDRLRSANERRRALSIVNRESQRLGHMVDNILRFSGSEHSGNSLVLKRQAVGPIVSSVVDEFQAIADATETVILIELDENIEANVDADAMRQVMLNLLDNAVKYGPIGQTVRVTLKSVSRHVCISVSDQGPGIPVTERERIWAAYYRLDRERGKAISGTGIGLAVVGDLVREHGGTIRVEDAGGNGACFIIELPV